LSPLLNIHPTPIQNLPQTDGNQKPPFLVHESIAVRDHFGRPGKARIQANIGQVHVGVIDGDPRQIRPVMPLSGFPKYRNPLDHLSGHFRATGRGRSRLRIRMWAILSRLPQGAGSVPGQRFLVRSLIRGSGLAELGWPSGLAASPRGGEGLLGVPGIRL